MADLPAAPPVPLTARAPFRRLVLTCAKCARKLDGEGFGRKGRDDLRRALKRELKRGGRGPKVRVVETACLGLCPKQRQVVATPALLAAGRLLVVRPGEPAEGVLERLLGPEPPQG